MAKKNLLRKLVLLVILVAGTLCNAIDVQARKAGNAPGTQTKGKGFSCSYPTSYEQRVMCRGMEDQILASTVRIEMLADLAAEAAADLTPA